VRPCVYMPAQVQLQWQSFVLHMLVWCSVHYRMQHGRLGDPWVTCRLTCRLSY
jgi:hypothetical protein